MMMRSTALIVVPGASCCHPGREDRNVMTLQTVRMARVRGLRLDMIDTLSMLEAAKLPAVCITKSVVPVGGPQYSVQKCGGQLLSIFDLY